MQKSILSSTLSSLDLTIQPDDPIHGCGPAVISLITRCALPDDLLDLAHVKLHTWPYKDVPLCWRRLHEEASLIKAARDDEFATLVATLDRGISLSGTPRRFELFRAIFQELEDHLQNESPADYADHEPLTSWNIDPPSANNTIPPHIASTGNGRSIIRATMNFEAFQTHLDNKAVPVILKDAFTHWPANELWNPAYFLRKTLNGHRIVPVEIGRSYTDVGWSQRMMPFLEFLTSYLLPEKPAEIGYLAQHDLFHQIPDLRDDISIPDYCYTSPPENKTQATVETLTDPLLNIWLGPKGTQTPLHTDPYHNILCQVVGYKYIRLYSPAESEKMYPRGVDDKGVSMENTSNVDLSNAEEIRSHYPDFEQAEYVECILGPGEALYVPVGWWHYVESLTTAISVSFWWN
jgi:hypothetical protein